MKILNIAFNGKGSEKQVAFAADIFNAKMNAIKNEYASAIDRVNRGNMPESFKAAWELVLSDDRLVKFVEMVASSEAKLVIETKGNVGNKCFATIVAKLVEFEYSKAVTE